MAVSEKRLLALEKARAARRATGKLGGRPLGVLNKKTIARIKTADAFVAEGLKHLGEVQDDLLRNSKYGDTRASIEVLDRTIGPVRKDFHLTGDFSMRTLHIVALPHVQGQAAAIAPAADASSAITSVPLVASE